MLFILFFISLLGTVAFRKIRVFGESNNIIKRRCSDDIIDILRLRHNYESRVRIIVPAQMPPENTWFEGEVPWNITDDNNTSSDNNTISVKVTPPFDPLEPCSIGHLFA